MWQGVVLAVLRPPEHMRTNQVHILSARFGAPLKYMCPIQALSVFPSVKGSHHPGSLHMTSGAKAFAHALPTWKSPDTGRSFRKQAMPALTASI